MSDPQVLVERRNGVADVVLNRPDRLNALDTGICRELESAFLRFGDDPSARCVLLRGAGRGFCAGGDVKRMQELVTRGSSASFFDEPLRAINRAVVAIAACPRPVIAALHGPVAGAGFNLALAADIRLASEDTRFNQAFIRLGLVPDTGGTLTLPQLCGPARAAELCFLGDVIDAHVAGQWGLVNRIVPPETLEQEARSLAERLAAGPAEALSRTKRLLRRGWVEALREQAERERLAQVESAATSDFAEGLQAFFEKRPARFEGS